MDAVLEVEKGTARLGELDAAVARLDAAATTASHAIARLKMQIDSEQLRFDLGEVADDGELHALRGRLVTEESARVEALAAAEELKVRIQRAREELALRQYQRDIEAYADLCLADDVKVHDAARTLIAAVDASELAYRHFGVKQGLWRKLEAYRQAHELPAVVDRGVMGLRHIPVTVNDLLEGKVRTPGDVIRKHVNPSLEPK